MVSREIKAHRREALEELNIRVTLAMNTTIGEALTESELHRAALAMIKNKAPRPNGLIIEILHMYVVLLLVLLLLL